MSWLFAYLQNIRCVTGARRWRGRLYCTSVLVQDDKTGQVLRDLPLRVALRFISDSSQAAPLDVKSLSREHASNRLMQSATVKLPKPGKWQGMIYVGSAPQTPSSEAIAFRMTVHEQPTFPPAVLWAIAIPFLLISVFILREMVVKR